MGYLPRHWVPKQVMRGVIRTVDRAFFLTPNSPIFLCRQCGLLFVLPLKRSWAKIVQRRVLAFPVVEDFNIFDDGLTGGSYGSPWASMDKRNRSAGHQLNASGI